MIFNKHVEHFDLLVKVLNNYEYNKMTSLHNHYFKLTLLDLLTVSVQNKLYIFEIDRRGPEIRKKYHSRNTCGVNILTQRRLYNILSWDNRTVFHVTI